MSKKLTPWFPAEIKPKYIGLYQRDYASLGWDEVVDIPDFWDGQGWILVNECGQQCGRAAPEVSFINWRGLAKKP